jgi:hypothetical protein
VGREHGWVQLRPDLERRLDGALTHRLTTVVAAAGYGKSTALDAWAPAVNGVVHRLGTDDIDLTRLAAAVVSTLRLRAPDLPAEILTVAEVPLGPDARRDELARAGALAATLAESLSERLTRDVVLVLDDVDAIREAPSAVRFIDTLVRAAPRRLHVVTASRAPLPFATERLRHAPRGARPPGRGPRADIERDGGLVPCAPRRVRGAAGRPAASRHRRLARCGSCRARRLRAVRAAARSRSGHDRVVSCARVPRAGRASQSCPRTTAASCRPPPSCRS